MKTSILLLMMIFTGPVVHNNTGNHGELYSDIVNVLQDDLGLSSAQIEIVVADKAFNKAMINQHASIDVTDGIYVINLQRYRSERTSAEIFIHELIHVSQVYRGKLKIHPGYIWFEGKFYNNSIPDEDREYEKEAWIRTYSLYRKYVTTSNLNRK